MSVKTLSKLNILRIVAGVNNVWVGVDDTFSKGQFTWKEDRSGLTDETRKTMFLKRGSNVRYDANCCHYSKYKSLLDGYMCNITRFFICEMSIEHCTGLFIGS